MGLYRLKAGSHVVGFGPGQWVHQARDPANNVVESDDDLAAFDPGKFEPFTGDPTSPAALLAGQHGLPRPPGPPTDFDRAQAALLSAQQHQTAQLDRQIEELQRQAETLQRIRDRSAAAAKGEDASKQDQADREEAEKRAAQEREAIVSGQHADVKAQREAAERDRQRALNWGRTSRQVGQAHAAQPPAPVLGLTGKEAEAYQQTGQVPTPPAAPAQPAQPGLKEQAPGKSQEELESMTVDELKEHAAAEEIELPSGARKDEIIKTIRKAKK